MRDLRSNAGMDEETRQRLTDLEIKASFLDDTVDELNQEIVRQQRLLERLVRELAELRTRSEAAGQPLTASLDASARALAERPPHY